MVPRLFVAPTVLVLGVPGMVGIETALVIVIEGTVTELVAVTALVLSSAVPGDRGTSGVLTTFDVPLLPALVFPVVVLLVVSRTVPGRGGRLFVLSVVTVFVVLVIVPGLGTPVAEPVPVFVALSRIVPGEIVGKSVTAWVAEDPVLTLAEADEATARELLVRSSKRPVSVPAARPSSTN